VAGFRGIKTKNMILFKKADELVAYIRKKQSEGIRVGLVPTMGALHQGHLSLLEEAKKQTGLTVSTIFVNPTQFNDPKDYKKYPVTIEKDLYLLEKNGLDLLFLPGISELYPDGTTDLEKYDLGYLENILEGVYRPGHFQGVCQVMNRLLSTIGADDLFMGQKDYQQCMVIQRLLELTGSRTILHTCPTQREPDGLAMSSRNMRLTAEERERAVAIYQSLVYLKNHLQPGPLIELIEHARQILKKNHFHVDYVAIADARTLVSAESWDGTQKLVALVAAFQQQVRLIDNMLLNP
jgi:pantoate--beta-alanine ligase